MHCLIIAQRQQHFFKSNVINGQSQGGKKNRTCRRAAGEKGLYYTLVSVEENISIYCYSAD